MGKVIQQKVVEKCDEWLSTRNKRKVPTSSRLVKKHPLSSMKMNSGLVLTQNSPPPPELKTNTRQSNITSFFKTSGEITPGVGDKKTGRKLHFKDEGKCGDGLYQTQRKKIPFSLKEYGQKENVEQIDIKLTKDNTQLSDSYLPSENFLENTTTGYLEEGTELECSHSSCWQNEKTSACNQSLRKSNEGDILLDTWKIGNDLDSELAVEESDEKLHKISSKLRRKNILDSPHHFHTLSDTVAPVQGLCQDSCESICSSETDLEMSHKWRKKQIYDENNEYVTRTSLQEKPIATNTGVKCFDLVECGASPSCTCYEFSSSASNVLSPADGKGHDHEFSMDSVHSFESFELTEDVDNLQFSNRRHLLNSEEADLELEDFSLSMHT